ncbi:MAG: MBL fold metallo-hydrolase [Chloroflexota bacterium]|nr:MBL fold metallo-hydrolase [Chloroflexota bacterium]
MNLTRPQSMIYSSNVYLIRGDWNAIEDVNTLIDVGNDPAVIERIRATPTGVGKKAVEQVILTHGHFDHTALLPAIREAFDPVVYAHSMFVNADRILKDGQTLRCGDRMFKVIHTPGHSSDSICLYCEEDGVLFVGDTPVLIRSSDGSYEEDFVHALERLCRQDVRAIYFGHGDPVTDGGKALMCISLENVRKALSRFRT